MIMIHRTAQRYVITIHVVDLAVGHEKQSNTFSRIGTGYHQSGEQVLGYSVLDMVKAFSKACGKEIPYEIKPRREGDIAMCYADPSKIAKVLGWKAERSGTDVRRCMALAVTEPGGL